MLTETFQKCFISACLWVNPYPYIWAYMALGATTPHGSPTEYSMDTYSILWEVNFQGLRFRLSPKLVQKQFGNISEMFHSWQCTCTSGSITWFTLYIITAEHSAIILFYWFRKKPARDFLTWNLLHFFPPFTSIWKMI